MDKLVALFRHQLHVSAHGFNELGIGGNPERESEPVGRIFLLGDFNPGILKDFSAILANKVPKHRLADSVSLLLSAFLEIRRCASGLMARQKEFQQPLDLLEEKEVTAHAAEHFVTSWL